MSRKVSSLLAQKQQFNIVDRRSNAVAKMASYKMEQKLEVENVKEQAGAELGQAQLPTGIWLYCD